MRTRDNNSTEEGGEGKIHFYQQEINIVNSVWGRNRRKDLNVDVGEKIEQSGLQRYFIMLSFKRFYDSNWGKLLFKLIKKSFQFHFQSSS